jgi:hypothetical protein
MKEFVHAFVLGFLPLSLWTISVDRGVVFDLKNYWEKTTLILFMIYQTNFLHSFPNLLCISVQY